ncbi:unnamed protein product [Rodentolepis nana]|uniref:Uncharacterized protein n=1 Tax=Rodentolepis nana TaxID=102285 RepID=A0A0R3TSM5_RODNA|nr:unnamed protein product [Rodentolepis nana]
MSDKEDLWTREWSAATVSALRRATANLPRGDLEYSFGEELSRTQRLVDDEIKVKKCVLRIGNTALSDPVLCSRHGSRDNFDMPFAFIILRSYWNLPEASSTMISTIFIKLAMPGLSTTNENITPTSKPSTISTSIVHIILPCSASSSSSPDSPFFCVLGYCSIQFRS